MGDLCSMHKGLAHLGKLGGRIEGGYRAQVFENSKKEIKPSVCISTGSMPEKVTLLTYRNTNSMTDLGAV